MSDDEYKESYSEGWNDAILTVQLAAKNGTLVERFLNNEVPEGLGVDSWRNQDA